MEGLILDPGALRQVHREMITTLSNNALRALADRIITSQSSSTFQSHILTALMPSTTGASPTQEQPEREELIKRYTSTEKLSGPPSTPYEGAGGRGQPGWSDKESERQILLQKHTKEMVVECGKEDEEQGEGKAELMRTMENVWHLEWHL